MSDSKLNFIHLCDAATVDSVGKLNMLGIFDKINLSSVPSAYPRFTVVVSMVLGKIQKEKNMLKIVVKGVNGKELEIAPRIELGFDVPPRPEGNNGVPTMNLMFEVANLEFKEFGKHTLDIVLNDKVIGSKNFLIEKK